jgi:hypothetical protein
MGWLLFIMLLAGVFGGIVNIALNSQRPDRRAWIWSILAGVAAALLIPLFLRTVSSNLASNLLSGNAGKDDWFVFAGFCLLAAISSKAFIQTLSDRILREVQETRREVQENKQEVQEAKLVAKRADDRVGEVSAEAKQAVALAEATRDATQYGLTPAPATTVTRKAAGFPEIEPGSDKDDPWAGQFGQAQSSGRELTAEIQPLPRRPGFAVVRLTVQSTDPERPLTGAVQFYLHPTFANRKPIVPVEAGKASLTLLCWGAFTVGALADEGKTRLELDLSRHPDAEEPWRSR